MEEEALELSRKVHLDQVVLATEVYLALFDIGEGKTSSALVRAKRVHREADAAGHAEPAMFAMMVEALALLMMGNKDEAADVAMMAVEVYKALGGTQQFEVEIHMVASSCLAAVGRREEAAQIRGFASDAMDRRLAPVSEFQARNSLLESIGGGLPKDLLMGRRSWFSEDETKKG